MNVLVVANIFAAVSLAAAHQLQASVSQVLVSGTCASIGYSTACCPPDANCQAADGNCRCSADCHMFSDCCDDVYCPPGNMTMHTFNYCALCLYTHIHTHHVHAQIQEHVKILASQNVAMIH